MTLEAHPKYSACGHLKMFHGRFRSQADRPDLPLSRSYRQSNNGRWRWRHFESRVECLVARVVRKRGRPPGFDTKRSVPRLAVDEIERIGTDDCTTNKIRLIAGSPAAWRSWQRSAEAVVADIEPCEIRSSESGDRTGELIVTHIEPS